MSEDKVLYDTGAQRVPIEHEVRYDLESPYARERRAKIYAEGSQKYDEFDPNGKWLRENFRKGLPVHDLLNHMERHLTLWKQGDTTEDHLAKASWALDVIMEQEKTQPQLNDMYFHLHRRATVTVELFGEPKPTTTIHHTVTEPTIHYSIHSEEKPVYDEFPYLKPSMPALWKRMWYNVVDTWDRIRNI